MHNEIDGRAGCANFSNVDLAEHIFIFPFRSDQESDGGIAPSCAVSGSNAPSWMQAVDSFSVQSFIP